jgi:hypothetical protein
MLLRSFWPRILLSVSEGIVNYLEKHVGSVELGLPDCNARFFPGNFTL